MMRAYEAIVGGVHDRAMVSATKIQAVLETSSAAKAWAVAASAAAVAGGGYATVEHVSGPDAGSAPAAEVRTVEEAVPAAVATPASEVPAETSVPAPPPEPEFGDEPAPAAPSTVDREFGFEEEAARPRGRRRPPRGRKHGRERRAAAVRDAAPARGPEGAARPSADTVGEFDR